MTTNLGWTEVAGNQNQKEVTINDGLGRLDAAMTAELAVDLTGADKTLTTVEFQSYFTYNCTGHTVARNLTVTAVPRVFFVVNGSGTSTLTVVLGGSNVVIAASGVALIYSNGTTLTEAT